MTTALAALFVFPLADPIELMVDLFYPEDTLLTLLMKRPHVDDIDTARLHVGLIVA